ncbi:archaea-specific SMC-related protein [Halobellus captivus]|uniref:archaea-specific SMC-related protein n=1 Tax=Halobellus captivus TaxID=2592614 RepID=UPI0011A609F3|nr:archaea-specific SMC-related protein [Halobellus captivus]
MSQQKPAVDSAKIDVKNIGGIDKSSVEFDPGITILTGRNATNRTSLLQAIMGAVGSDNVSLKADADEGEVHLELDGDTYTRTLSRQGGQVTKKGEPYLDDPMLADLFAFLLETNESRQAVARDDDLREIIMRPVDTHKIESEISGLEEEKSRIDKQISTIDRKSDRLPELEEEKKEIKEEIDNKEKELEEKQRELDSIDKEVEKSRQENAKFDAKMTELQKARSKHNSIQKEIQSEKESIEALEGELAEKQSEFDDLSLSSDNRNSNLDEKMQRLRGQVEELDQTINELYSLIQFNDSFVNDGEPEIINELDTDHEKTEGAVTDELLSSEENVTCWTCGTNVAKGQIESNLEDLRSLHQDKIQKRQSLKQEIQELQNEKRELEEQQQQYKQLERAIDRTENEITDRQETLDSLQTEEDDLSEEISQLESDVETLQEKDHSKVLEVQENINYLEFELDDLTSKLDDANDEIESIQDQLSKRDELKSRREGLIGELEDLRTHIEQLQKRSIEEFNEHMDAVLELLDYENLERIWIERTQETVRDGRRKVDQNTFTLHVVRSTESGTVYEDTIDHLSESEREVTGLVFALAGYLVHDVYETVPFMLIDSIEAIDSKRIADLVEYLEGYADYLVVALLVEDAAALGDTYQRITAI